jgi:NADH-quinone oxidoreductase subunit N
MLILISSNDFFIIYLGIELQSLSLYVIIALYKNSNFGIEAALKYYVTGTFASGLLLLGTSLLYGYFGSTNYLVISELLLLGPNIIINEYYCNLIIILILTGIFFKLGLVPFHF